MRGLSSAECILLRSFKLLPNHVRRKVAIVRAWLADWPTRKDLAKLFGGRLYGLRMTDCGALCTLAFIGRRVVAIVICVFELT